jgi:hypothetical protein
MNPANPSVDSDAYHRLYREIFARVPTTMTASRLFQANVTAEGLRPYQRFLHVLFSTALDSYLGDDVVYRAADRRAHFEWCLAQAVAATSADGHRYAENAELIDYLREYLRLELYSADERPELSALDSLLNPEIIEARAELNSFLELWAIFEATPRSGRRLKPRQGRIIR